MPNWVFNSLSVTGPKADLDALRDKLNAPVTKYHYETVLVNDNTRQALIGEDGMIVQQQVETHYSNPVLSFYNIVAPDPSIYDEYYAVQAKTKSDTPITDPNWWKNTVAAAEVSNHWYDWNNRNWGTKWDVAVGDDDKFAETEMEQDEYGLHYRFQTAWGPVDELLVNVLSVEFPTLKFDYDYEEEQGWGGSLVFQNGEILEQNEYDIPETHQDFVDRGQECWACAMSDGQSNDYLFDDCPRDEAVSEKVLTDTPSA